MRFQAKRAKYVNFFVLSKLLMWLEPNFAPW